MELPFIDEHAVVVAATPERAWDALADELPRAFGSRRAEALARALDARPARADGGFPHPGATLAGFRVTASQRGRELVLAGEHRFSRYALELLVEPAPGGARVRARTLAEFPGVKGRLYRAAVIGSRGHVLLVRRILRSVKGRAERG